jgi:hypothetical protein
MENQNDSKFDPKAFLGAKVISPLEQEKLLGGTAETVDTEKEKEVKEKEVKEKETAEL